MQKSASTFSSIISADFESFYVVYIETVSKLYINYFRELLDILSRDIYVS